MPGLSLAWGWGGQEWRSHPELGNGRGIQAVAVNEQRTHTWDATSHRCFCRCRRIAVAIYDFASAVNGHAGRAQPGHDVGELLPARKPSVAALLRSAMKLGL